MITSLWAITQIWFLTPRRSFPFVSGLRFAALGATFALGVMLPAEILVNALWQKAGLAAATGMSMAVFPDPFIEEAVKLAAIAAGLFLVPAHRSARLSDVLFWAITATIGANFFEDTLRFCDPRAHASLRHTSWELLDPSHWREWLSTFLPGGFLRLSAFPAHSSRVEFGWAVSPLPAAVGLWLLLRGQRAWGSCLTGLGLMWATLDHTMYNLLVDHASFAARTHGWSATLLKGWQTTEMGSALRWFSVALLIGAFVIDERFYSRARHRWPGAALLGDVRDWLVSLGSMSARRARLALGVRRLDAALRGGPKVRARVAHEAFQGLFLLCAAPCKRRAPFVPHLLITLSGIGLMCGLPLVAALGAHGIGQLTPLAQPALRIAVLVTLATAFCASFILAILRARRDPLPLITGIVALAGIASLLALAHGWQPLSQRPANFISALLGTLKAIPSSLDDPLGLASGIIGLALGTVAMAAAGLAEMYDEGVGAFLDEAPWLPLAAVLVGGLAMTGALPLIPVVAGSLIIRLAGAATLANALDRPVRDMAEAFGWIMLHSSLKELGADKKLVDDASSHATEAMIRFHEHRQEYALELIPDLAGLGVGGIIGRDLRLRLKEYFGEEELKKLEEFARGFWEQITRKHVVEHAPGHECE